MFPLSSRRNTTVVHACRGTIVEGVQADARHVATDRLDREQLRGIGRDGRVGLPVEEHFDEHRRSSATAINRGRQAEEPATALAHDAVFLREGEAIDDRADVKVEASGRVHPHRREQVLEAPGARSSQWFSRFSRLTSGW